IRGDPQSRRFDRSGGRVQVEGRSGKLLETGTSRPGSRRSACGWEGETGGWKSPSVGRPAGRPRYSGGRKARGRCVRDDTSGALAAEGITILWATAFEALVEPGRSLFGSPMGKRLGVYTSAARGLNPVIAYGRGGVEALLHVPLFQNLPLLRGVTPHSGV